MTFNCQNLIFKNIDLLSAHSSPHLNNIAKWWIISVSTFIMDFHLQFLEFNELNLTFNINFLKNNRQWVLLNNRLFYFFSFSFCLQFSAAQLWVSVKHARQAKKRFRDASVKCTEAPSNGLRDLAGPWNWVILKKCKQEHLIFLKIFTSFFLIRLTSWLLINSVRNMNTPQK